MKRVVGLDLLKIVSMFMVVLMHVLGYTGGKTTDNLLIHNFSWLIESFCYVCVDCFALVTGYVMYQSEFKLNRIIKFVVQVFTISVIVFFVLILFGYRPISKIHILNSFFPILTGGYWFAQAYIVVLFVSPMINKALRNMNFLELKISNISIFCFFCVFYTFGRMFGWNVGNTGYILLIVMYVFGASYKKYVEEYERRISFCICIIGYLISIIILYGSIYIIEKIQIILQLNDDYRLSLYSYNSVFVVVAAMFLFCAFEQLSIKKWSKTITTISTMSFAVYLFHMQPMLKNLYIPVFCSNQIAKEEYYFVKVFVLTISIFIVGIGIEIVRLCIGKIIKIFLKRH